MNRVVLCTFLALAACSKASKVDTSLVGTVPRAALRFLTLTGSDAPLDLVVSVPGALPGTIGRSAAPRLSGFQAVPAGEATMTVLQEGRVVATADLTLPEGAAATACLTDGASGPSLTVALETPPADEARAFARFIDASPTDVAAVTLAAAGLEAGRTGPGSWTAVEPQEAGVLVVTTQDGAETTFAPVPLAAGSLSTLALVGRPEDGNLRIALFVETSEGGPTRKFIYPQGIKRPSAGVRLLHGIDGLGSVRLVVDDDRAAAAVAYKELAASIDLPIDAEVAVESGEGVPLLAPSVADLSLVAGHTYTLALLGSPEAPKLVAWEDQRSTTTEAEATARVALGVAGVPGTFSVVRKDDPSITLMSPVAYGEASPYAPVPAGPVDLIGRLTVTFDGQSVTRDVATLAGATFPIGRAVTIVGVGRVGTPPAAPSITLLVIDDAQGTVGVLDPGPVDPPPPPAETASVRFLNATAVDGVTLSLDGRSVGSLQARALTNAQEVPVNALLKAAGSVGTSPELTLALDKARTYTVAVIGDGDGLDLVTWEDDRSGAAPRARFAVAAPGSPGTMKLTHGAAQALFEGVGFGSVTPWTTPPSVAETLALSLVVEGSETALGTLPSVAWPEGHAATLVATGTLTASPAASQLTFLLVDEATGALLPAPSGVDPVAPQQ
ncbi:MAG: hypothetical protein RL199_1467 [Pseudomonadota bacterium]|jgi:hypothetical protein